MISRINNHIVLCVKSFILYWSIISTYELYGTVCVLYELYSIVELYVLYDTYINDLKWDFLFKFIRLYESNKLLDFFLIENY